MDPLDILTNKDMISPFFQPVFSADEQCVIGYEVLGRFSVNNEIVSLGPFFHDETVPDEYRVEIDDYVTKLAIEKLLLESDTSLSIFINRNPNLLMNDRGESLLNLLLTFQEQGFDLSRVILEVTEHNFTGDLDQLNHVVTYFRTFGIKLAVDNVGKEGSNLERLRLLEPDILKVDLRFLHQTTTAQSYLDILYSLSLLARKIGAALLYEDIESLYQLQYAWKHGGRYYQGFYLAEPKNDFINKDALKDMLRGEFQRFISQEKRKISAQYEICNKFSERFTQISSKLKSKDYDQLLLIVSQMFTTESFRIYICDEDGFQQSANIYKDDKQNWVLKPEYIQKNWSWRPYFLENIARMIYEGKGILSDLYSDIETGETIRTFSYPISNQLFIFVDLSYAFLYEHENLM